MFTLAIGRNTLDCLLPVRKTQTRLLWALLSKAAKHVLIFEHMSVV